MRFFHTHPNDQSPCQQAAALWVKRTERCCDNGHQKLDQALGDAGVQHALDALVGAVGQVRNRPARIGDDVLVRVVDELVQRRQGRRDLIRGGVFAKARLGTGERGGGGQRVLRWSPPRSRVFRPLPRFSARVFLPAPTFFAARFSANAFSRPRVFLPARFPARSRFFFSFSVSPLGTYVAPVRRRVLAAAEVGQGPCGVAEHGRAVALDVGKDFQEGLHDVQAEDKVAELGAVAGNVAEGPHGLLAHVGAGRAQELDKDGDGASVDHGARLDVGARRNVGQRPRRLKL